MQLVIVNLDLEEVGRIDVPQQIFGDAVKESLLWEQARAQRASARAGTHATKKRGQVSGGGAKPYKQKGTGRARQGSNRAPNHVGGGVVFGPQPRNYAYRLPRSARRAALRSALSLRNRDQTLVVLDGFAVDKPRTKAVEAFFQKLAAKSVLLVDQPNRNLQLSARNLPKAKFLEVAAINVLDIVKHQWLVITQAALADVVNKASATRDAA